MRKENIFLIITIIFSILCCSWFVKLTLNARKRAELMDDSAVIRAEKARKNKSGDIQIGVVYDNTTVKTKQMRQALELAAEEINNSELLSGRKLILDYQDDRRNIAESRRIAQKFANDINTSIVIGHPSSTSAIKFQPIYEFYGILFFTPSASSPVLSSNGSKLFFRNYPDDNEMGRAIAKLCQKNNWKDIAILFPESVYGKTIANSIESIADIVDANIVIRQAFNTVNPKFSQIIAKWQQFYKVDGLIAIFDYPNNGIDFLNAACKSDLKVPIILTPDLAELDLEKIAARYPNTIYIMDIRPENASIAADPHIQNFITEFTERTGTEPNFLAFNAYDGLYNIAQAIKEGKSPAAPDIAEYLRTTKVFTGVGGRVEYQPNGNVKRTINIDKF